MPGEYGAALAAEIDAEPEQAVRTFDELGGFDARDAKVDARELLGADLTGRPPAAAFSKVVIGHLHEFLHACRIDARRERLVFADRRAEQRRGDVTPMRDAVAEESLRALRDLRQDRLQVGHQHAEKVDALRADRLHFRRARRILRREPGFLAVDVEISPVGERHDLAYGGRVFERLPGLHDARAGVDEFAVQAGSGSASASRPP